MTEAQLAQLKSHKRKLVIRKFSAFVRHFWRINDPGAPLVWSWPLQVMCDHIQAWEEGALKKNNLAVMVPPGSAKSTLLSVMYPAWVWASRPSTTFLYVSGSEKVALRDSMKCMDLMQSEEYQDLIQPTWEFDKSQMAKELFKNSMKGFRQALSAGARITGTRCDRILVDDAVDAAAGKADMLAVANWWFTAAGNRLSSLTRGKRCVIQQRLDELDLIGSIMEREPEEWEQLILRMEHEIDDVPPPTSLRTPEHPGGWTDPRTNEGELLFPERFPRHVVQAEKVRMGSFAYASQNQQKPMAQGGNLFKADWFRHFEISNGEICCDGKRFKMSECTIFGCADTAFSEKRSADYTAIATCLVTPERHLAILDVIRRRMQAPDVKKELEILYGRGIIKYLCIEDKASGIEILQDFVRRGMIVKGLKADTDKVTRSQTAQVLAEQGRVWLPKDAIWLSAWMDEITRFPKGKFKDQVDGSLSYPAIEVASCSVFNSENSLPAGGWGMKRIF